MHVMDAASPKIEPFVRKYVESLVDKFIYYTCGANQFAGIKILNLICCFAQIFNIFGRKILLVIHLLVSRAYIDLFLTFIFTE